MKEFFLNKELSLLAKEKGFDEPCFAFYHKSGRLQTVDINIERVKYKEDTDAPLYQQIIDWFRERHTCIVEVDCDVVYTNLFFARRTIGKTLIPISNNGFKKYYEALDKAIEEAFKLI